MEDHLTSYREVYEQLKKLDVKIAEKYISDCIKSNVNKMLLDEARNLLNLTPGQSILSAIKRLTEPARHLPEEIKRPVETKRLSQAVSKEERNALIERMAELGLEYSPKDSYKRMLRLVQKAEAEVICTQEPVKGSCVHNESGESEKRNVVTGW